MIEGLPWSAAIVAAAKQDAEAKAIKAYIAELDSIKVPRVDSARLFVRLDGLVTQIAAARKWIETL